MKRIKGKFDNHKIFEKIKNVEVISVILSLNFKGENKSILLRFGCAPVLVSYNQIL